uniref:BPTI/Kunitz inhibitor domain-containing protein n=1 Tax=Panagrolaimus sp. JU765 TaxID=591449 RepID=A0AC34QH26_9BILA
MYQLALILILPFVFGDSSNCLQERDRGDNSCGQPGGLKFFYDKTTKHCQPFFYNGCGGNTNRFNSVQECRDQCSNVTVPSSSGGHSMVLSVPKCSGNVRAAIDDNNQAISCSSCPLGYTCSDNLCCPIRDYLCNLDYDAGKFAFVGSHTPRYFFSKDAQSCLLFTYYGALGNANNFETFNDCMKFCKSQ